MRLIALTAVALALAACSPSPGSSSTSSSSRTSSPAGVINPADTKAADLRTQLDLLLGEQVLLMAKQSAAAVDHSDAYAGYTTLLTTNGSDLSEVMLTAFGSTAADQFSQMWSIENGYLVDYTIGVVTHNQAKANGAMSGLVNGFVPQLAQLITSLTQLPLDPITQLLSEQVLEDKVVIESQFALKPTSTYPDLHTAYLQAARLGDALAPRIAQKFPDKFPGNASAPAADRRVALVMLLQENAYVATMATDSIVRGASAEQAAATTALAANADSLGTTFSALFGNAGGTQFDALWASRDAALLSYANAGDGASKQALTQAFVSQLSTLAHISPTPVADQVAATIQVIDDQRSKTSASLPNDDRAAAGGMQALGDAVVDSAPQG
ncbi:MAG: hypothetical protein ACREOM_02340 [Candidatus Dormibacteraceae bacterium]